MKSHLKNVGDHLYVAVLLPFDRQMKIDEAAYRSFLQYFLKNEKFVRMGGGLVYQPGSRRDFLSYPRGKAARARNRDGRSEREGADPRRHLGDHHGRDGRNSARLQGARGRRDFRHSSRRRTGRHLLLGRRQLSGDLARPNRCAGSRGRFTNCHPSGRRGQAAILSWPAARSNAAHLPRGSECRRLEDDVHVRRLPADCQWLARTQPSCRSNGRARLAVS